MPSRNPRKRPRDTDPPKRPRYLKNPQGLDYVNFHGRISLLAHRHLMEVSRRLGVSAANALGVIILEHKMVSMKSGTG